MKKKRSFISRMCTLMMMVLLMSIGVLRTELSADQEVARKEAGLQSFPVSAGETIYKGAMVCVDADGYLVAAADTAGYKFVGIAYEKKENTTAKGYGSDGDLWCRVYTEGVFELTCTGILQTMVGQLMFVADDDVVDNTSTNYVCAGKLVEFIGTTSGWVDIGQRELQTAGGGTIYGAVTFAGAVTITGALSVDDTTAAPNGLTGSIHTDGGIGVMGESAFEANVRIQGRLLCNANLLVAGALDVTGGVIFNGTLNCGEPVTIAPGKLFRAMGNAFLEAEVRVTGIPTSDPHQVGELWNNSNVANISAG